MHQTHGKDEYVASLEGGSEQFSCGVNESHVDLAAQYKQNLGGSGVGVGGNKATHGVVDASQGEAQCIQSGEVDTSEARGDGNASWGHSGGHLETGEHEVIDGDVLGALARNAVDGEHALEVGWAVVIDVVCVAGHICDGKESRHCGNNQEESRHCCG